MNGLSMHQAFRPKRAVELRYHLRPFESMLQHSLYPDPVDGSVRKCQFVRIGQKMDVRRIVDIEGGQLDLRIRSRAGRSRARARRRLRSPRPAGAGEPSAPGTAWRFPPHPRFARRGACGAVRQRETALRSICCCR
jgi:hypothetical protein